MDIILFLLIPIIIIPIAILIISRLRYRYCYSDSGNYFVMEIVSYLKNNKINMI